MPSNDNRAVIEPHPASPAESSAEAGTTIPFPSPACAVAAVRGTGHHHPRGPEVVDHVIGQLIEKLARWQVFVVLLLLIFALFATVCACLILSPVASAMVLGGGAGAMGARAVLRHRNGRPPRT